MRRLKNGVLIALGSTLVTCATGSALTTNLECVADTGLFEHNPNNNLGGMSFVTAGTTALPSRSRALLKFDPAAVIPSNATVISAELSVVVVGANGFGHDFGVHHVLRDWGEGSGSGVSQGVGLGSPANSGEATWNARFYPGTQWSQPGAEAGVDYLVQSSASATMNSFTMVFTSQSLAADVEAWLQDPDSNFGWLLKIDDENSTVTASKFATREDSANAPVLKVEYELPTTPTAPTLGDFGRFAGEIRFSFNGESGLTYTVEFTGDPATTNWVTLTNISALPSPTVIQIADSLKPANRFYRARTP